MVEHNLLWQPSQKLIEQSRIFSFMSRLSRKYNTAFTEYETLYNWSVTEKEVLVRVVGFLRCCGHKR